MKTRRDLCEWIVEALTCLNGRAQIRQVRDRIWEMHGQDLRDSGNLHFTWQDDIYWAATQLRSQGILKNAKATSKNVWELA